MITSFFLESDGAAQSPEIALWRAVIAQALDDATLGNMRLLDTGDYQMPKSIKHDTLPALEQARIWFERGKKDFRDVCELAGVVPEKVQRAALTFIAHFDQTHDWRSARGGIWK